MRTAALSIAWIADRLKIKLHLRDEFAYARRKAAARARSGVAQRELAAVDRLMEIAQPRLDRARSPRRTADSFRSRPAPRSRARRNAPSPHRRRLSAAASRDAEVRGRETESVAASGARSRRCREFRNRCRPRAGRLRAMSPPRDQARDMRVLEMRSPSSHDRIDRERSSTPRAAKNSLMNATSPARL